MTAVVSGEFEEAQKYASELDMKLYELENFSSLGVARRFRATYGALFYEAYLNHESTKFYAEVRENLKVIQPEIVTPYNAVKNDAQYYKKKMFDIQPERCGEYTLNPEMDIMEIDVRSYPMEKRKVIELPEMSRKGIDEVARYVAEKYSASCYIPGLEYWLEVLKRPRRKTWNDVQMTDGESEMLAYFFFGSMVRRGDGKWCFPFVEREKDSWRAGFTVEQWHRDFRVVLFDK